MTTSIPEPDQSHRTRANSRPCLACGHPDAEHDYLAGCTRLNEYGTLCVCPAEGVSS